jgi:hypothetical protein
MTARSTNKISPLLSLALLKGLAEQHNYDYLDALRVHKSTEHGKLTPVFGNACPPRGLSGLIRDFAYNFSEGRLSHWILLMAADRVDMVEKLIIDLSHLRVPNIPAEMELTAELKYNRKGLAKKAAIVGLGAAAFVAFSRRQKQVA